MSILDGIRTIDELTLENQRVLVRADVAAPAAELDEVVLRQLLPTLEHAMAHQARVVIAAHAAPREDQETSTKSLESFGARLSEATGWEVFLPDDCLSDAAKRVIGDLRGNQICLLENLMFHAEETRGDETFARALSAFADVYVNDAFDSSRQRYASLTSLPRLVRNRGAGLALARQVDALNVVRSENEGPLTFLLGGSPSATRLDIVEALVPHADAVLLGAELGRLFLAARHAAPPTKALEPLLPRARSLAEQAGDKLILPRDFKVQGAARGADMVVKPAGLATAGELLDVGPESMTMIETEVRKAKTGVLNGRLHVSPTGLSTLTAWTQLKRLSFGLIVGADAVLSIRETDADLQNEVEKISVNEEAAFDWLLGKRFFGIEALTGASNE